MHRQAVLGGWPGRQDIQSREDKARNDVPLEGITFVFVAAFLVLSFRVGFFLLQDKNSILRLSQNIKKKMY